jgi:hypothetical protein
MTRFTTALVALVTWLWAVALVAATGASADSQSGLAADRADGIVQGTLASSGPRTWHVLVGGYSKGQAIQAEGITPT